MVARSNSGESRTASTSAESEAFCEDGPGDVETLSGTFVGPTDVIDITSATLTRANGVLTVRVALDEQPPHDVGPNEAMSFAATLMNAEGETLYTFDLGVSHFALNDHQLEAHGSEFGDQSTVDAQGISTGSPITQLVDGRIERASIVLAVPLDALPQLPDQFFWEVYTARDSLMSSGVLAIASDACPEPYPSNADDIDVSTWAAPSEGQIDGDGARTTGPTQSGSGSTATASTIAATGEPCVGASACGYENGIDFEDLRRNIATQLVAEHGAIEPAVDCDGPNESPPNRIPPGEIIRCDAVDANGDSGTIEVTPQGFGQYSLRVTSWSSDP